MTAPQVYHSSRGASSWCTKHRIIGLVALLWCVLVTARVDATTYYISPSGSNGNNGLSQGAPWLTFNHALPFLDPGDTLFLLDGTYTLANSGMLQLTCGSGGIVSGSAGAPITVKALNERQAHVQSNGTLMALRVINCAYWTFEGMYLTSADNNSPSQGGDGSVGVVEGSDHLIIQRNIFAFTNRFYNSHLLSINYYNTNHLIQENEFYSSNRHGLMLFAQGPDSMPSGNIVRRNYLHSRDYGNIPGGVTIATVWYRGAAGISCYPCHDNIFENNIVEDWDAAFDIQCKFNCGNNKYYGNIVLSTGQIGFTTRGDNFPNTATQMPTDMLLENNVVYKGERAAGFGCRGCKNVHYNNNTIIDGGFRAEEGEGSWAGVLWDASCSFDCGEGGDGNVSAFATNMLMINIKNSAVTFGGPTFIVNVDTWGIDYLRSWANTDPGLPPLSDSHFTHVSTSDPGMGSCKAYIPDLSNLKGAGLGGKDIGANVLYRYQDGILTSTPLWDTTTGAFPCGAILPGVNDIAGSSCYNVHTRLNVNSGGCAFPASFSGANPNPLQGHWAFDEASGATALDSSGNGRHGTLVNAPARVSGQPGGALRFDGNEYVTIPALNISTLNASFTAWVKGSNQDDYTGILFSRNGGQSVGMHYSDGGLGELAYTWNGGDSATYGWHSGLVIPTDNTWAFVAITIEPTKATAYLCIAGTCSSAANTLTHVAQTLDGEFRIGSDAALSPTRNFTGTLDGVRLYNSTLTPTEITDLAQSSTANITSNLLSWWKLDGTTADAGSNAQAGTLVGSPSYDTASNCRVGTGCLLLNGTTQYMTVVQNGEYNLHASAYTLAAWVKDDTSAATLNATVAHRVLSWYDGTNSLAVALATQDGTNRNFYAVNSPTTASNVRTTAVATGWHHIIVTFNGASTYHMYVDGVLADNASPSAIGVFTGNSTTLYIGQRGNGAFLEGALDDVRIYGRALTAADALALYSFSEGGTRFPDDPTGLSVTGNTTATFPGNPISLSPTGNTTATFSGNPSGLSVTGTTTPTFPGDPTALSVTSP